MLNTPTVILLVACGIIAIVSGIVSQRKRAALLAKMRAPFQSRLTSKEQQDLSALFEPTALPCIRFTPVRKRTGILDSKLGGVPYLPPGFPYPYCG